MDAGIKVLTLGVADLERSLRFYRDGMGLETEGIVGTEFEGGAVVFFHLAGGLVLALWPTKEMLKTAGLEAPAEESLSPRVSLGHNVRSREEVDAVLAQAANAGAPYVDPGQEREWGGYAGHFLDPDHHLWEVVWNPNLMPD